MKLNFYYFAIVQGSAAGKLNPATVRSYALNWTNKRVFNEIASAIYGTLTKFEFIDTMYLLKLFASFIIPAVCKMITPW